MNIHQTLIDAHQRALESRVLHRQLLENLAAILSEPPSLDNIKRLPIIVLAISAGDGSEQLVEFTRIISEVN